VQLVSKISNLCDPDSPTLQTDRRSDRRTDDMQSQYGAMGAAKNDPTGKM